MARPIERGTNVRLRRTSRDANVQAMSARPPQAPLRVVVVDDHATVRRTLRRHLSRQPGFEVVGEACDGRSAVDVCLVARPDVALIDLRMPVMDGLDTIRALGAATPEARLVLHSACAGEQAGAEAIAAGATAVIDKSASLEELLAALRPGGIA